MTPLQKIAEFLNGLPTAVYGSFGIAEAAKVRAADRVVASARKYREYRGSSWEQEAAKRLDADLADFDRAGGGS